MSQKCEICVHVYMGEAGVPYWCRHVSLLPPLFGWINVHAPQFPVVAMARVLVALHLEGIVLDVVDWRQDNPLVVFLYSSQNWFCPEKSANTLTRTFSQCAVTKYITSFKSTTFFIHFSQIESSLCRSSFITNSVWFSLVQLCRVQWVNCMVYLKLCTELKNEIYKKISTGWGSCLSVFFLSLHANLLTVFSLWFSSPPSTQLFWITTKSPSFFMVTKNLLLRQVLLEGSCFGVCFMCACDVFFSIKSAQPDPTASSLSF